MQAIWYVEDSIQQPAIRSTVIVLVTRMLWEVRSKVFANFPDSEFDKPKMIWEPSLKRTYY